MDKENKTNLVSVEEKQSNTEEVAQIDPVDTAEEGTTKQLPPNVEEIKGRWWLPYVITGAVLSVATVLVGWLRGGFVATATDDIVQAWCDAFSIVGVLALCFGLLVIVSNGGAFDMLTYSLKTLFRSFKRDPLDRKYGGYYEYTQARRAKKRSFWYFVIVGGAFLLVGIVLLIVLET